LFLEERKKKRHREEEIVKGEKIGKKFKTGGRTKDAVFICGDWKKKTGSYDKRGRRNRTLQKAIKKRGEEKRKSLVRSELKRKALRSPGLKKVGGLSRRRGGVKVTRKPSQIGRGAFGHIGTQRNWDERNLVSPVKGKHNLTGW